MIPKVIHYCWFGGKEEPSEVKKCIDSWRKYCPDYLIIKWSEDNFDIHCNQYMYEAYMAKKWAFVSDYARLKIVHENGGIYLDTDVELLKSLDDVLDQDFFFAIEKDTNVYSGNISIHLATGLGFGAQKSNKLVASMMKEYEGIHFFDENGNCDLTPCPIRNAKALERYGYKNENTMQMFCGGTIYPADYFCPEEYSGFINNYSKNTISIHHYSSSWKSKKEVLIEKCKNNVKRILACVKCSKSNWI